MTDLNTLARTIHDTATKSGFWPTDRADALAAFDRVVNGKMMEEHDQRDFAFIRRYIQAQEARNMGEMLMLATSELAEALEEHRDGHGPVWYKAVLATDSPDMTGWSEQAKVAFDKLVREDLDALSLRDHKALINVGVLKPEGLAVELADCIIRCLDTMQSLGVDIEAVIEEKMGYNSSRPYKHGKKF